MSRCSAVLLVLVLSFVALCAAPPLFGFVRLVCADEARDEALLRSQR